MGKKIIVTGTGRSGTTFLATTLQHLRINATHEGIYGGPNKRVPPWRGQVEVSWAALLYREKWPPGATILHLVRHPLRTIESHLNVITGSPKAYVDRGSWVPPEIIRPEGTNWSGADWCAWHYITWNRCVQQYAQSRWQIEKMGDIGSDHGILGEIRELLCVGNWQIEEAMAKANRHSVGAGANVIESTKDFVEELQAPLESIIQDYGYE